MPRKFTVMIGAIGLAAGVWSNGTPVQAQALKAGILQCHASSGFGLIFGTTREVSCAFVPSSGAAQHYVGHIDSFGFDAGYTEAGVLLWAVLEAATTPPAPGALAGTFEPHPNSTFVGERVATNTLIGGSGVIALLPIDLQPNTNINDAAGVAKLTLTHQP